jgi:hypothetical protein
MYYAGHVRLVKKERNAIIEAIKAAGLDPTEFDIGDDGDEVRISHRGSESAVVLHEDGPWYSGNKVVGDGLPQPIRFASRAGVVEYVVLVWLKEVKLDLETPDLWAELEQQRKMLDVTTTEADENTPFTTDEQAEIAKQLAEIKTYVVQTHELSGDQTRALEGQFKYLQDAAGRMGRTDWRTAAAGVLLSAIVNAVLPGSAARDALLMLFQSVGHMFGHPMPLLGP